MRTYSDALAYLYGLEKFGMVFGLANIEWILDVIGNPHRAFKIVHVGGTNGKGSVVYMLSAILRQAGYRVGRYTSPHLVSFTERIAVDDAEISEEEVVELTSLIRHEIERKDPNRFFTFFDFTTTLAFEYFLRCKVDIAVIEVGLGGRLDSTNVVQPSVSVITNVAFDHMDYLGDTITDIAKEKAGIIKKGVPVVTGAEYIARRVIEETAGTRESPVYVLGKDFSYEKSDDQRLSYRGLSRHLHDLYVNLQGDHQLVNGAIALCAIECLSAAGLSVGDEAIYGAMSGLHWQGRLETVREKPIILLDAAHNTQGTQALGAFISTHYKDRKKTLVFGVMRDKEYGKMLKELLPLFDTVIFTKPETERALSPYLMQTRVKGSIVTEDVRSALVKAKSVTREKDLILITGSFYTIGEAKVIINEIF
jgi:dihydrofolate synthase / folylpolyglutamate synthase